MEYKKKKQIEITLLNWPLIFIVEHKNDALDI